MNILDVFVCYKQELTVWNSNKVWDSYVKLWLYIQIGELGGDQTHMH